MMGCAARGLLWLLALVAIGQFLGWWVSGALLGAATVAGVAWLWRAARQMPVRMRPW